ncbi:MAG: hypothetical protein AB9891_00410 [Anaerolineaceae bacterium]
MVTLLDTSPDGVKTVPEWSTLNWNEMKRVFNVDEESLPMIDDESRDMQAGMWSLVNWEELGLILKGDEGALKAMEEEAKPI